MSILEKFKAKEGYRQVEKTDIDKMPISISKAQIFVNADYLESVFKGMKACNIHFVPSTGEMLLEGLKKAKQGAYPINVTDREMQTKGGEAYQMKYARIPCKSFFLTEGLETSGSYPVRIDAEEEGCVQIRLGTFIPQKKKA